MNEICYQISTPSPRLCKQSYLLQPRKGESDVDPNTLEQASLASLLVVIDVLAELLDVGGRSDDRNQLLEVVLEGADILDVEKEKVFSTLGESETMNTTTVSV